VYGLTRWSSRWVPSAFVIACLLTLVAFGMVVLVARKSLVEALGFWDRGFWQLLELSMQMSLIVLTGYIVAVAPSAARFLNVLASVPRSPRSAVIVMGLTSMALSWVHWGLGLVGAPIFLRFLVRKQPEVDYRLASAAGYLGTTCVWHAGLSGSAPLLMATPKHFMENQVGLIPLSTTTFSFFNLVLTGIVVAIISMILCVLYPKGRTLSAGSGFVENLDAASGERSRSENPARGSGLNSSERFSPTSYLESSYAVNLVLGALGFSALFISLKSTGFQISLNTFNFAFLFLALTLHPSPRSFVGAAAQGIEFVQGIIIQFPFYAGMYGLIYYSGLAQTIAHWFVTIANARTFPVLVYWYSGILSYFIPSGGSKWIVEAPYILSAAKSLGVPFQQVIVSYAWGDMSTHFLQPFWAIPLLTIAKLEFKDIVGYLGILFIVNSTVVSIAFLLMPLVW